MFKEFFTKLCNERGLAPSAVCELVGLSNSAYSKWDETSIPRKATLYRIAEFFNVSVDYLLGKEDTPLPQETTGFTVADQSKVRMIPVYDTASAGFGALASSQPSEYTPMYFENAYEADNTICIRVKGDSMAPIINNGDIVHVLKQDVVERGYMAVVLVDDEGFVKYLDYGTGWIELVSQNPMYRTMRFEGPEIERVRVVGLVTGITRRGVPHMNK